jgi:hypothetical protein
MKTTLGKSFEKYDLFSQPVPRFHIEGQQRIGTGIGFCLTILLVTLLISYSTIRGLILVTGDRPQISSFTIHNERKPEDLTDLNEKKFKVAFAVQKLARNTPSPANDPDFIEWVAFMMNLDAEAEKYEMIGVHKCTTQDFEEFNEIEDA